jgi:hypothetical protein
MRIDETETATRLVPLLLINRPGEKQSIARSAAGRYEVRVVRSSADALNALTEIAVQPAASKAVIALDALHPDFDLIAMWIERIVPAARLIVIYPPLRVMKHVLVVRDVGVPCTSLDEVLGAGS